jgi:hypothetical protein
MCEIRLERRGSAGERLHGPFSEKDAALAQKSGQLQPYAPLYSHRNALANLHFLGQPDALLAHGVIV